MRAMSAAVTPPPADRPVTDDADLFLQTVPRTLVHRAAVSEVLMTGLRVLGDASFRLGAHWPREHSFYSPVARRWQDPMLLAETIRQAILLISHSALDVPMGHQFLSHDTVYEVEAAGLEFTGRPTNIVVEATCDAVQRRAGKVAGFTIQGICYRDEVRIGSGHIRMNCISPAAYARLRGEHHGARPPARLPTPVAPELVGRASESDVVLGATAVDGVWTLRTDLGHPVLFDHPLDHVPGMVTMEAARQAARIVLGSPHGLALSGDFSFVRYIELDQPCLVSAEVATTGFPGDNPRAPAGDSPTQRVRVRFDQCGSTVAEGLVGMITPTD